MVSCLGFRQCLLASYFAFSVHSLVGTNRNGLVLWELIAYRCEQARIGRRPKVNIGTYPSVYVPTGASVCREVPVPAARCL